MINRCTHLVQTFKPLKRINRQVPKYLKNIEEGHNGKSEPQLEFRVIFIANDSDSGKKTLTMRGGSSGDKLCINLGGSVKGDLILNRQCGNRSVNLNNFRMKDLNIWLFYNPHLLCGPRRTSAL